MTNKINNKEENTHTHTEKKKETRSSDISCVPPNVLVVSKTVDQRAEIQCGGRGRATAVQVRVAHINP